MWLWFDMFLVCSFCFLRNVKCHSSSNGLTCPFPVCLLALPSTATATADCSLEIETTALPPRGPYKICVPLPRLTMALITFCFLCNVKCRGSSNGLTCSFPICLLAFPSMTMDSNL